LAGIAALLQMARSAGFGDRGHKKAPGGPIAGATRSINFVGLRFVLISVKRLCGQLDHVTSP
jgi:hypothetical protein